jgi:hypothetical protein
MRLVVLLFSLAVAVGSAGIVTDPFHETQTNCNYSTSFPYSSCDVIGSEMLFDIQMASVSISGGTATVDLYFNSGAVTGSGNSLSFASFVSSGDTLVVGDLFFYDPSDPLSTLRFGVPLADHGQYYAGDLYSIGGTVLLQDAEHALLSNNIYRLNQIVLMSGFDQPKSTGSVAIHNYGDGTTNALYDVTVTFPTTAAFLASVVNNQIGILFSSADCGNDVIQGVASTTTTPPNQVPDPYSAELLAMGLALIGGVHFWRKRAAVRDARG